MNFIIERTLSFFFSSHLHVAMLFRSVAYVSQHRSDVRKIMSRFDALPNCLGSCDRTCCSQISINRDHFWKILDEMANMYYTCPSDSFIYEKVIRLNVEKNNRSTFSIGLDPENKFEIGGRLEVMKSGVILRMNYNQLTSSMKLLKDYEHRSSRILSIEKIAAEYNFMIRKTQACILEINMNGYCIHIDEESLTAMCRLRTYIQGFISSLKTLRMNCEETFFKLLNHFIYGKTFREACDLAETEYKRMFFDEVVTFHCDCLDKMFVVEIATHFEKWFAKCVQPFLNTFLLNESVRLQTFSSTEWPHDDAIIDAKQMAKCGLFFIGTSDETQCVFCKLILHGWEAGDDPVEDHFKYKPSCQFLLSPEKSLNVSDVGCDRRSWSKLSSVWKTSRSFDEVDLLL